MPAKNIFFSILFGLASGAVISIYFKGLDFLGQLHVGHPGLIFLVPFIFIFLLLLKRKTSFYPTRFKEISEAGPSDSAIWSRLTVPINLIGSWISHLSGASLGRESTAVVLCAGLSQSLKMDWNFWKPIAVSMSFAAATGHPMLSLIVMIELFFTNTEQKVLSVISSWIAILVMQSFKVPILFSVQNSYENKGFFSALFLVVFIGVASGYFARLYVFLHDFLNKKFNHFRKTSTVLIGFLALLGFVYLQTHYDLSQYKSLGTQMFVDIQNGNSGLDFIILKSSLTLLFVAMGFIGGEFVPALLIGAAIGVMSSQMAGENLSFGFACGLFSFFAGLSKMKWTALSLVFLYFGFSIGLWAYLAIFLSSGFSGEKKIF